MNDDILTELRKISGYLELLSLNSVSELITILKNAGILNTRRRVDMFLLIDGNRTIPEIAKEVGVSERGAQLFIKELAKRQIVNTDKKGRAYVPVKNYESVIKIIQTVKGGEKHNG